jgi:hypothetical protein
MQRLHQLACFPSLRLEDLPLSLLVRSTFPAAAASPALAVGPRAVSRPPPCSTALLPSHERSCLHATHHVPILFVTADRPFVPSCCMCLPLQPLRNGDGSALNMLMSAPSHPSYCNACALTLHVTCTTHPLSHRMRCAQRPACTVFSLSHQSTSAVDTSPPPNPQATSFRNVSLLVAAW